ncbi:AAA family ATPase, partial [Patescibacteria group bacterium]|nr:AAA family ATPase [Patescibacteria group bacterium]
GKESLTVVVGPNGSGKSNLADAIRWCLGEQSIKLLRGKKAEDIIFSGSTGKGRSGFAQVELSFDNADGSMKVDYSQVVLTRRLYRDGESEYLLNSKKTRLSDIQVLLAEAGIGQRTYSVVAQGMIDHVLTSSPEERKIFFDDATGVRSLQIKRQSSISKLRKATENLMDVQMLLGEIEPRLRILKRQVARLEKREKVEVELHSLQLQYYGNAWWSLQDTLKNSARKLATQKEKSDAKRAELKIGDEKLLQMEQREKNRDSFSGEMLALQSEYRTAQKNLQEIQQKKFESERQLELARVQSQSNWSPLPLHSIIEELTSLHASQDAILKRIKNSEKIETLEKEITEVFSRSKKLKERLTKPNPEDFVPDPKLVNTIKDLESEIVKIKNDIKEIDQKIDKVNQAEKGTKTEIFSFQRELRKIQSELYSIEQEQNIIEIEKARIETRIEGLSKEINEEIPKHQTDIQSQEPIAKDNNPEETRMRILKLKHELELIGGIEEETIEEYKSTNERFDFLGNQLSDLQHAIKSTEKIIDELDERIQKQSEKAFKAINEEFQKFFKILFGGGSCSLIKVKDDNQLEKETKIALDRPMEEMAENMQEMQEENSESVLQRFKKRRDTVTGIEIQATPPGKRLKALNLLSGGERALTSIALLSAIMATNPSPFVVLDEVDAALDESNTVRFANILTELRKLSQFIIVTHNRATMERADQLYGVTMGEDGVSSLLSVKMQDIAENGTARR